MANLKGQKATKTRILNRFPTREFGLEGDFAISSIKGKGVYLCAKIGNTWYAANKMQELKKLEKTSIMELKTNKLTLNKLQNSTNEAERLLISDNTQVKYRTVDEMKSDLGISIDNIDYKTAYCSIANYTDKKSCEDNGGTWYYSENDSHDNISSTAENQLLTVGQSIGAMDAEPTLTYDGSTLEIKYNSDYDDNWQSSAQTHLLKLTYDTDNFGNIGMNDSGVMSFAVNEGNSFFFYETQSDETLSARMQINSDDGILKLMNPANILDYFSVDIDDNAVTTIKTHDTDTTVGHLTIQPDGDLVLDPASQKIIINAADTLYFDGGTHTSIRESSDDTLSFVVGGTNLVDMIEAATNQVNINSSDLSIDAAKKLFFDGGGLGNTYIYEVSDDVLRIAVGGDVLMMLSEKGDDGNEIHFGSTCVGFTQLEPTYDATTTVVDFRHSNKQNLTFESGNITNLQLFFPLASGNFQLLVKQDGTGSRTITNYKVYEFDESLADGQTAVKWAGGSNPTLTTDANHVDILSFYWDADNEIAYGVATLDFQF